MITRFAPSPTGTLHLGHAYSALFAHRAAGDGEFLLRIEDIDPVRCKPEFTPAIMEDLRWLGLDWPEPVRIQSEHMADYGAALDRLRDRGLLYPCFCTRREIEESAHAPHRGPEGPVYLGTCRHLPPQQRDHLIEGGKPYAWRLDMARAVAETGPLDWHDRAKGIIGATPELFGDIVLARKDIMTSYHLSVTVDDHLQGVTLVTRGEDLLPSTHIHRLLQALLGYAAPDYWHHPLMTDASGRRYAKRDQSQTLRSLRENGMTAAEVRAMVGMEG